MKISYLLSCVLSGITVFAFAQPGTLDPAFGSNGTVTTLFNQGNAAANAVAIQTDGKMVVVGKVNTNSSMMEDFALTRYNTDGSLDASFGASGLVSTDFNQNTDEAKAVAIQSDGKILAAGHAINGAGYDFAIARYLSSGTLDNTFGVNGKVVKNFGSTDFGLAISLLSNGKIVVAGRAYNGSNSDFALLQLNSNGTIDNSFGNNGIVKSDLFGTDESANAIAIQSDGKIVAVGDSYANNISVIAVARFNPNGSLDPAFSSDGKLTTTIGVLSDVAYAVALQPDGKIVVAGQSNTTGISDFALARYLSDGTPDNSFNGDGQLTTSISTGGDYAYSLAIQPDGKILAGGSAAGTTSNSDFAVVRYLVNGDVDAAFGVNGIGLADFSLGGDVARALVLKQNTIVMAGYSDKNSTSAFAVARFVTNASVGFLELERLEPASFRISPNPAREIAVLEYNQPDAGNIQLQLYNLQGNMLHRFPREALTGLGTQKVEIQLPATIPAGLYLLCLQSSHGNSTVRLNKM